VGVKQLDNGIDDTFASSLRDEVSVTLIEFKDSLDGEKPRASGMMARRSIRKDERYHRPIAGPILFWLNSDSLKPPGGMCQPSDDFRSKVDVLEIVGRNVCIR
jgi:hypothetical protein